MTGPKTGGRSGWRPCWEVPDGPLSHTNRLFINGLSSIERVNLPRFRRLSSATLRSPSFTNGRTPNKVLGPWYSKSQLAVDDRRCGLPGQL
jgi:hypothetical protein